MVTWQWNSPKLISHEIQQPWTSIITVQLQSASWHLKSPATEPFVQQFVQANCKENIEVPHFWPFVRRTHQWHAIRDWWIPSNAESISMTWHYIWSWHWKGYDYMACMDYQTCQPLRILRNHYAFRVSNTPLCKPVQNVGKLRILRNFGAIRPIPRNLQQFSRPAVSRKSPAGQNIDKDLFILRLPSASASDFATRSTKEASWRGETMPNET